MHREISAHNQRRGPGWSDREGPSLRTSARGRTVGDPKHKAPPQLLYGGSGYTSRSRSRDSPDSQVCLDQERKRKARTNPMNNPGLKKEIMQDRIRRILQV